ncbi:hypothetical protein KM043_017190 [Ampulex compressa]|nr:hypothetical protein KM043_017190 [Ampulex compressa]
MSDAPKVEFAIGSEMSPGHFFKSSFARSFITSCRETKSLDYEFLDNGTIAEEAESHIDGKNNNFFSLINFADSTSNAESIGGSKNEGVWKTSETTPVSTDTNEIERLRKQCQALTEENQRLQGALSLNQAPHLQVIDNVLLQTQVDTLQWQLKQTEANRLMYRSLMEQVVRFLDRARKSLDILHEKNNPKDKSSSGRVPRSRSVHAVHADSSPSRGTSTSSSSSSGSSRFTRAKSVTQISAGSTSFREFTWSVLRRNDPVHCTPPRNKAIQDLNKTHEGVVYRRPKQIELDPDDVPPEKLSQEAFRLMRTVQSLLSMREPDLARITPTEDGSSPSPVEAHHHEASLPLQTDSFVNSTTLQDAAYVGCSSSDRGNESSSTEGDNRTCFPKSLRNSTEVDRNLQNLLPGVRRSLDSTSLNSGSSKATEEELRETMNGSIVERDRMFVGTPTSTPVRRTKKVDKKEPGRSSRSKPTASVSSAEDESGFSSMSSFQEVGLPTVLPISPIKGCHTEIGLPEVPLEKTRHRRWSSTPAEMQAFFKQHRATFSTSQATTESLSVWV